MTDTGVLDLVEAALGEHFGCPPARASVSFLGVEPIEILRYEAGAGELAFVSLGMARAPMAEADAMVRDPHGPRAELLLQVRTGPATHEAWRRLAVLAAAPVVEGVVYTAGMSVDLGQPFGPDSICTGALIIPSPVAPVQTPSGAVDVLGVVPATNGELAWARVRGTAALRERWAEHGTDLADLSRRAVTLG